MALKLSCRLIQPASGRGTVWSFVVPHPPLLPAYAEQAPYNVIVVALGPDEHLPAVGTDHEDRGPLLVLPVAFDEPDRVEPSLAELSVQRDLGCLHRHRVRRAPAQVVEVELAGAMTGGERDRRRCVDPAVVQPVWKDQQVPREPVSPDVGDLPGRVRLRLAQCRGHRPAQLGAARVVPAVGADAEERVVDRREAR